MESQVEQSRSGTRYFGVIGRTTTSVGGPTRVDTGEGPEEVVSS